MKIGTTDISDLKLGSTQINKVMSGSNLIWQKVSAPSVDPDYQAVLDYATANSIPLPDASQQSIDNQLIIDYKATGGWAKDDTFFKFNGTADPSFKLICWKRKTSASAFGSLTWSVDGVKGNFVNAWIDSLLIPSGTTKWQLNNAGVTAYLGLLETGNNQCLSGSENRFFYVPYNSTSSSYYYINSSGSTDAPNGVPRVGLNGIYRTAPLEVKLMGNGSTTFSRGSSSVSPNSIGILARKSGAGGDYFSNERVKYHTIGASKVTEFPAMETVLI